jgi:antibiotic biosynthesis monooxygenase (ABM) superfamily enzyme
MPVRVSRASSVIVHRVPPTAVERFLALQEEFTRAAEAFPGYQGTEVYPPAEPAGTEWVVLIHFADAAALRGWLDSAVRGEWVEKVRGEFGEFRLETLPGGFGSWFAGPAPHPDELPPGWKMVLTVLLGLYPTVILLTLAIGRVTDPLGLAVGMLIGNALSVSILQYAVMPVLTRLFGPWLRANTRSHRAWSVAGAAAVLLLLAGLTVLFRQITG